MTVHAIGSEVHIAPDFAGSWPARAHVPHSTFVVEQVPGGRRTTYLLRHSSGAIRIKAYPYAVLAGPSPSFADVEAVPLPVVHASGTVVEHANRPGLWVVTGYTAKGHQIFPLGGGDSGRRNVPGSVLTVVTLDLGDEE